MIDYPVWGRHLIDCDPAKKETPFTQMDAAMSTEPAVAGALMPDAHLGYGLPVGGVYALDNAVCPYAVGPDIACRMKISIFDGSIEDFEDERENFIAALKACTFFGTGGNSGRKYDHPVLDMLPWSTSKPILDNMERAKDQLGTSGSGNHFVEFGILDVPDNGNACSCEELDIAVGKYIAVMSHSGSRGTGFQVCQYYSKLAAQLHPELVGQQSKLGWLDLDTEIGQDYWMAMELMGDYAQANHDCIHDALAEFLGVKPLRQIENHHNFAWKEFHNGREVVVHRKGATPAGPGVLGVIPGSMGTPAYIVSGLGNAASLHSASHGAGRAMGRKDADRMNKPVYRQKMDELAARGITVISCGADELCNVYKDIEQVMDAQTDLVEKVARFDPRIVKMCHAGERAED